MRFLFIIFFSFANLILSGCWFDKEEEVRESITSGLSPKTLFNDAKQRIEEGAYDEATKIFNVIEASYPSSKYAIQSKLELIYMLYKRERYDDAINNANEFLELYPNHFSTPYVYFIRGVISETKSKSILDGIYTDNAQRDIQSVKDALNYFILLLKKYPNTKYAEEVQNRLVTLRNILARHELYVAIFYTKNDGYIAAINRCKYIIEKFPNTPSVPAALHLIAYNYDKINAPKLAEDARKVLKVSYPKYTQHYTLED